MFLSRGDEGGHYKLEELLMEEREKHPVLRFQVTWWASEELRLLKYSPLADFEKPWWIFKNFADLGKRRS
jgi:hypothetical protein